MKHHQAALAALLFAAIPALADPPTSQPADSFTRRLLKGDSTQGDPLNRMIESMDQARAGLADRRDTGRDTQLAQKQALTALDELIESAQRSSGSDGSSKSSKTQKRRTGQASPQQKKAASPGKADGKAPATQPAAGPTRGDRSGVSANVGEAPRRWGNLPPRDRAELLNGLDEEMPAKYREHIERYYRSLTEEEKP